ncbi:MAG: TonB-dependent receptor [Alistipes sp.]|nr:TonB-dependent receptor [Alistipes sp.]
MKSTIKSFVTGYFVANISNADLKWEASEQYNLGVDLGLWSNRLSLTLDLYQKDTKDLLLQISVPSYLGTSGNSDKAGWEIQMPYSNIGKVRNRGVDIALNAVPVQTKDFSWTSSLNVSVNRNEVLALNERSQVLYYGVGTYFSAAFSTASIVKEGQPMGVFYGYRTDGYFANEREVLEAPVQVEDGNNPGQNLFNKTSGVYVGDLRFQDLNKDGKIDANDQTVIGDPNPDFTFGWSNTFTYKNFDLSIGLNGVCGGDVLNIARYRTEALNNQWDNQSRRVIDRARIATDPAGQPYLANPTTARTPRAALNDINGNNRMSDRWLEDGSYLRIQNITLGYTLPRRWVSKLGMQNLKVYCTLQNLYTWTGYSGYDPEVGAFNQSAAMQNYDMGRYPTPRMYILGVNIGF